MSVRLGDIGTIFEVTIVDENNVVVNVSTATLKQILLKSPAGVVQTKNAAFTTTGIDGKIQYQTIAGDISTVGVWLIEGKITIPQGTFFSETAEILVEQPLV